MTAEQFLKDKDYPSYTNEGGLGTYYVEQAMIEFAKYHVEKALETAIEEVPYGGTDEVRYEDVKGILTCYPLKDIK